jgi:hypothetical protein
MTFTAGFFELCLTDGARTIRGCFLAHSPLPFTLTVKFY